MMNILYFHIYITYITYRKKQDHDLGPEPSCSKEFDMSTFKTGLLLAAMTALFMVIGFFAGGVGGMIIAFAIAIAMNAFSYWNSDKMVLRMHKAREVDGASTPELYNMVAHLAKRAELPMPKVYIIDNNQPNAFATGRNPENAAVAVTTGLLNMLNYEEIEGVMAHELAHVKNYDTLVMTITATIAGAISMIANFLQFSMFFGGSDNRNNPFGIVGVIAMAILAPMAAMLVQMAISRTREYKADRIGAMIAGKTEGLSSALNKIESYARRIQNPQAEANPATAHLFIINPLAGIKFDSLFSTHPNTQKRIAALNEFTDELSRSPFAVHGRHKRDNMQRVKSSSSSHTLHPWGEPSKPKSPKKGPWG